MNATLTPKTARPSILARGSYRLLPGWLWLWLVILKGEGSDGVSWLPRTAEPSAKPTVVHVSSKTIQGCAWSAKQGRLYFTVFGDTFEDTQVQYLQPDGSAAVWLDDTHGLSGLSWSRRGHLLGAQSAGHRIVRYSLGNKGPRTTEVLLEDRSLQQPNDVCEAPNGDLYFTDPDFLHHTRSSVFLLRSDGELLQLITDMPLPNGLALSVDSKTLYVSDSHERRWKRFPIMQNGVTGPGEEFFRAPTENQTPPNGMAVDAQGNLYLTGCGGVWVVDPEGNALGHIPIEGFCSSAAFGGKNGRTLFVTSDQTIYHLNMRVAGAQKQGGSTRLREASKAPSGVNPPASPIPPGP